jgi:hypothetical protein
MRSAIVQLSSRVEITAVRDVQVSAAVDDGTGGYVRALKIFGETQGSVGPALILEVVIQSDTRQDLNITTPELSF